MMKKTIFTVLGSALLITAITSCKKPCKECHYEMTMGGATMEHSLGEYCGSELKEIEENGYTEPMTNTNYAVSCHEH